MSHVDDGLLHGYLDGALPDAPDERVRFEAHLRGCPDCRRRLERARAERDEAEAILDLAGPDELRTPPFEELAERARGGAPGGAASGRRGRARPAAPLLPLAWAASLALAVGAGWLARVAIEGPGGPDVFRPEATARAPAPAEVEEGAPSSEADVAGGAGDAAPADAPATREREPLAEGAAADVTEAARAAPRERPTVVARTDSGGIPRSPDAPRAEAALRQLVAPPTDTSVLRARAGEPEAPRAAADAANLTGAASTEPGTGLQAEAPGELGWTLADAVEEERLRELEDLVDGGDPWAPVDPATAARLLGRPLIEPEGLPWASLAAAVVDGRSLVRSVHPLPDGARLVLLQTRLPEPGGDRVAVVVRGDVGPERLREWTRRLR